MRAGRLTAAVVAAIVISGCGPRRVATPAPKGEDLVVLLADPDGGPAGAASVSNALGAITLSSALDASETITNRAPGTPRTMPEARVTEIFGDALGALPLAPLMYTLGFKFDSDELTDESRAMFPAILQDVRRRPAPEVSVIGHTDTTGDSATNFALALKRANAVRALLLEAGFEQSYIDVASHGESDLLVPTPDNTAQALNRRVEITVR
jgi:outer membrane protein OmpA-like peptidoglycan-associated protein